MKCDACGLRDALIHVRQMQKNGFQELHLCEECAQERGFIREEDAEISVGDLLAGLIDGAQEKGGTQSPAACPRCGLAAAEFRKRGRAGCAECYEAFGPDLKRILSQMAPRPRHAGKLPRELSGPSADVGDREELAAELRAAVEGEDYERAARLRDRIRDLDVGV
jgi:protein arginine kinase activator